MARVQSYDDPYEWTDRSSTAASEREYKPDGRYTLKPSVPGRAPQYHLGEGALYNPNGSIYYEPGRGGMFENMPLQAKLILAAGGALTGAELLGLFGSAPLASSPIGTGMGTLPPAVTGSVPGAAAGMTSMGPSGLLASAPVGSGLLPYAPIGATLGASPLPSNMAGLAPSLGGGNMAALNANAAAAAASAAGNGAANGAAAAGGAAAARTGKDKLIDSLPLLAGALFGSRGPFGGGNNDGFGGQSAELESLLELMRQRMESQGPLFSAVNQGAYNLLPNSAKQGGMFSVPSSTGGR